MMVLIFYGYTEEQPRWLSPTEKPAFPATPSGVIQHFMEMLGTTDLAVPSADAPLPMTSISGFHAYLTLQSTEDHM